MWWIDRLFLLVVLLYFSYTDIKKREVNIIALFFFGIIQFILTVIAGKVLNKDVSYFINVITGVLPGILVIIISKLSSGKIGEGDGYIIGYVGLFSGLIQCINVLLYGSCVQLFYSLYLVFFRNKKLSDSMPMVPFITLGYVMFCIANYE